MGNDTEYVIVREGLHCYFVQHTRSWCRNVEKATKYRTVSEACMAIDSGCQLEPGLTIHRVVREPARVEEVPLREASIFAVEYWIDDEIFYAWKNEHHGIGNLAEASRFGSIDAAVDRIASMAQFTNRRQFRIVGVRETPGKVTTVEVG